MRRRRPGLSRSSACVAWCALAAALAVPASSATYRVDGTNGSDGNDGIAAPFRTIGRAVKALQTSDTLVITSMDQPYRESLPISVGGTAEQPLIIDGGGATLSGADPAPKAGWRAEGGVYSVEQETEVKFLFGPGGCYGQGKSADDLGPEQWFWSDGKLYFQPTEGKTPADYELEMSVRISGVILTGAGQIIVRNLTCRQFWNDGFNIHGGSAPVWFEDIRGLWNGDEGFSAHENCQCYVRDGLFAHNQCHGIADVNFARTHYSGVTVRDNVLKGIYFIGGFHSVIDSEVSGSPVNIAVAPSGRSEFPRFEDHPLRVSVSNFRNVVVRSSDGQTGVQVAGGAQALLEHCLVDGGEVGLSVAAEGSAYVINSVISGAATSEVRADGPYAADYNVYHPGRLQIAGIPYGPEQFGAYQAATGDDAHSWIAEPKFVADSVWASRASRARGNAFNPGYGGMDIGPAPRGARPVEDPSVLPPEARLTERGRVLYSYDFEWSDPWSRVYPEPEKNNAGDPVVGASELTTEQAHSGEHSAKVLVSCPPGPPDAWLVKLFSIKFAYDTPVEAVRFWLFGDGSGRRFRPRIRDASGECFYGPDQELDWTGWRQIAWDLTETPPVSIAAGDGNKVQDCPPIEVVLEVFVPEAGPDTELCLYVDDLEVELAGRQTP